MLKFDADTFAILGPDKTRRKPNINAGTHLILFMADLFTRQIGVYLCQNIRRKHSSQTFFTSLHNETYVLHSPSPLEW